MPKTLLLAALLVSASAASAQDMSDSDRTAALGRVRAMAACVEQQNLELTRVLRLIAESEQQRAQARDERVRRDADRALEALIARAAGIQRLSRACVGGADLPQPGVEVVQRDAPPDAAANALAENEGTVRVVERDVALSGHVHIVTGEQVDGAGRMEPAHVRAAMRAIAPRIDRCYESYLDRASIEARQLDLVFTFRNGAARASDIGVERSAFQDARLETCVRQAARGISAARGPQGGHAIFSYRLRFGR